MSERLLIFRRSLGALQPTDDLSRAALASIQLGECVALQFRRPRNLEQHRLFWALIQKVWENQEHYATPEHVCTAFKFACGLTDKIRTKRGEIEIPRSISFAKMDQVAFGEFFKRAVDFLCAEVVPGMNNADLEREILEMVR